MWSRSVASQCLETNSVNERRRLTRAVDAVSSDLVPRRSEKPSRRRHSALLPSRSAPTGSTSLAELDRRRLGVQLQQIAVHRRTLTTM